MLSKKEKERLKLVGKRTLINRRTGEKLIVDFDETPVFTTEECDRLRIGRPDMKLYSEMTDEEKEIFIEKDE